MARKQEIELGVSLLKTMGSGTMVIFYSHIPEKEWKLSELEYGKTRRYKVVLEEVE